jgi:hypothetical protein
LAPTYSIYKPPCLLLFEEPTGPGIGTGTGRVEIRDITSGKMCEVMESKGLKAIRASQKGKEILGLSEAGLVEIKETVPL